MPVRDTYKMKSLKHKEQMYAVGTLVPTAVGITTARLASLYSANSKVRNALIAASGVSAIAALGLNRMAENTEDEYDKLKYGADVYVSKKKLKGGLLKSNLAQAGFLGMGLAGGAYLADLSRNAPEFAKPYFSFARDRANDAYDEKYRVSGEVRGVNYTYGGKVSKDTAIIRSAATSAKESIPSRAQFVGNFVKKAVAGRNRASKAAAILAVGGIIGTGAVGVLKSRQMNDLNTINTLKSLNTSESTKSRINAAKASSIGALAGNVFNVGAGIGLGAIGIAAKNPSILSSETRMLIHPYLLRRVSEFAVLQGAAVASAGVIGAAHNIPIIKYLSGDRSEAVKKSWKTRIQKYGKSGERG